jgi:ribosomal protein L14
MFQIIDNTGALLVECVNVLKNKTGHGFAGVGDQIVCVVLRARSIPSTLSGSANTSTAAALKVRRGDVRRAVVVRTKKTAIRPDGRVVRFDDNAAVLINNKREMLGSRVGGVVNSDLRLKGWGKIVALAPKVYNISLSPGFRTGDPSGRVLAKLQELSMLCRRSSMIHCTLPARSRS